MIESDSLTMARRTLGKHCTETIEAAVLVHPGPDTNGRGIKKLFGKSAGSKLHTNNYLVLTPTHLRLFALGGRTGMKPKEEVGSWPREQVQVSSENAERSAWFASTGTHLDYDVYRLHIVAPDTDLTVDVRADAGLFNDDRELLEAGALEAETDPGMREAIEGLQEMANETAEMVDVIIRGTSG